MSETLLAEDRQRCRDAVSHTFDVDAESAQVFVNE